MHNWLERFSFSGEWDFRKKAGFALALALYVVIRAFYWNLNHEAPFSDIEDYVRIAKHILELGDFSHTLEFWRSYKPPTLPLFIAAYFTLRGSYEMDLWPYFQGFFHLGALLYAFFTIQRTTRNFLIAFFYFLIFTLSTSSVFWSLKAATESLSEAFLLFIAAFTIHCFQMRKTVWFWSLGLVCMTAVFLRPQFVPFLALIPAALVLKNAPWRCKAKWVSAFLVGAFLVWLPWGIRTYRLYGSPLFTSTQGPYSFLWELGKIETRDSKTGEKMLQDVNDFQVKAQSDFPNDYQAMQFAKSATRDWLKTHILDYLLMVPLRMWNTISDKSEYLTKLPRNQLFPHWADWILLDKVPVLVVSGLLGLIALLWLHKDLWPFFLLPASQWALGFAFLSYPRVIDPALPFFYSGNIFLILIVTRFLQRKGQ